MTKFIATTSMVVLSLGLYTMPTFAGGTIVKNRNSAHVSNVVQVGAYTGENSATGGGSGDAGSGGAVSEAGYSTGGAGGDGGNAGDGGTIDTGAADASSTVINKINSNLTSIYPCGCASSTPFTLVKNRNRVHVENGVGVVADTGLNNTDGGASGAAGNGGSVQHAGYSTGGAGGEGGDGGDGGEITTGSASAHSLIVNRVNRNITRIP